MSAKNWRQCPACKQEHERMKSEHQDEIKDAYGVVTILEYEEMVQRHEDGKYWPKEDDDQHQQETRYPDETMREDYEIGVNSNGLFAVSYSATCQCGFTFSFKESTQVEY